MASLDRDGASTPKWYREASCIVYMRNQDFVAYDQVNRTPAAIQRRKAQAERQRLAKPLPQLPPPVVVGHSRREEMQKGK